jgi:hypothetical protein
MKRIGIVEKIKDYHIRICIAVLILPSLFMFASGFTSKITTWPIPWWFALLYGWSGLAVSLKLSEIWYKDKE